MKAAEPGFGPHAQERRLAHFMGAGAAAAGDAMPDKLKQAAEKTANGAEAPTGNPAAAKGAAERSKTANAAIQAALKLGMIPGIGPAGIAVAVSAPAAIKMGQELIKKLAGREKSAKDKAASEKVGAAKGVKNAAEAAKAAVAKGGGEKLKAGVAKGVKNAAEAAEAAKAGVAKGSAEGEKSRTGEARESREETTGIEALMKFLADLIKYLLGALRSEQGTEKKTEAAERAPERKRESDTDARINADLDGGRSLADMQKQTESDLGKAQENGKQIEGDLKMSSVAKEQYENRKKTAEGTLQTATNDKEREGVRKSIAKLDEQIKKATQRINDLEKSQKANRTHIDNLTRRQKRIQELTKAAKAMPPIEQHMKKFFEAASKRLPETVAKSFREFLTRMWGGINSEIRVMNGRPTPIAVPTRPPGRGIAQAAYNVNFPFRTREGYVPLMHIFRTMNDPQGQAAIMRELRTLNPDLTQVLTDPNHPVQKFLKQATQRERKAKGAQGAAKKKAAGGGEVA